MKIYNSKDQLLLDVIVDDSSYRHRVIKGEHNLTLKYSLAEHVELPIGAYCQYQGEQYTLERPESFKMKHSRNFEYTVIMEAYQAKARIWKFRNTIDGRLKFPLTARPKEHLQMFIDNMNRRDKGWTVGQCIDDIEHLINYDHDFCWDALGKMATEFKTEFEIVGKRVSLRKVEYNKNNPLPLSYGCGNGFKAGLGRSNSSDNPPVEILYVQGSTQNIDRSKYGNSELLLPKGQTIAYDGERFDGEAGFNAAAARRYVVDEQGLSVRRSDKPLSSLAEDSLDCSTIYPKRVGTISSVVAVDTAKNFYDIIDNSIPVALNFENCLIAGETMTVIFQSGMLAGREFEVKYYHDAKMIKGVQKAARRFEIVPQEIDGITMPNTTFSPSTGDKYAVFKVMLPQAYICDNATKTGAEWDMFKTAVKYLFDNEEQKFTFTGELDGIWAKKDWVNIGGRIVLGGYILFRDERFQKEGVLLRITGIKDYINKPHSPVIEISNKTVSGGFTSDLKKLESGEVLVEEYHKDALQFTKRRFRDAKETMSMLEAAMLENFTNNISPIAIQTMQMLVGDESLQFRFVNNRIKPVPVDHKIIFDNATKQLKADTGLIQHLTIGIKSISTNHAASEYRFWTMNAFTSARLDNAMERYYLYIKANKVNETAEFTLSTKAIKMEEANGYYHFLVGMLGSEYEGERSFTPLYGFTEVLPGRITTDKIVSGDGTSYFDMLANALKLGDMLQYNVNGDGRLKLRGTIVQSQSGDESPIGCFRGVFNALYTYYSGDEVTYLINGSYSTYRYINATPSTGHLPTETAYWTVVAQGQKGDKGQQGEAGRNGIDGKTSYLHVAYSNSADGKQDFDVSNSAGKFYIGTYTDFVQADSTDPTKYKWVRIKGKDGVNGTSEKTFIRYSDDNGKTFTKKKPFVEETPLFEKADDTVSTNKSKTKPVGATIAKIPLAGFTTGSVYTLSLDYKFDEKAERAEVAIFSAKWKNVLQFTLDKSTDFSHASFAFTLPDFARDGNYFYARLDNTEAVTEGVDGSVLARNVRIEKGGVEYPNFVGRNLAKGTLDFSGVWNFAGAGELTTEKHNGLSVLMQDGSWNQRGAVVSCKAGRVYTFSFFAKVDTEIPINCKWVLRNVENKDYIATGGLTSYGQFTTEWKRYSVTIKFLRDCPNAAFSVEKKDNGSKMWLCGYKVEYGDKATEYSPAPEDLMFGLTQGKYIGLMSWDKNYPPLNPQMYQWSKATGENGKDADYQEYRFAKNGSTTTAPSLNKSVDAPTGWTLEQPVIGKMEYLWAIIAKKKANGTLITSWSDPVRMTPYDGKDGKDGVSPALVFCGVYDPSKTYYGNQYRIDACKYENAYYVCRIDAGEFKGVVPTNTAKWNSFGASFESIATNLLLAEGANIAGWIFRNNRLESQDGAFWLDGIEGKMMAKGGFSGALRAESLFVPFVSIYETRNLKKTDPTNIILSSRSSTLTLPHKDFSFNGMFLNIYIPPRITREAGGSVKGRILCPNKGTIINSINIEEYYAKNIYSNYGGVLQIVNVEGVWVLLNGTDYLTYEKA